jgi:hypothetical protein
MQYLSRKSRNMQWKDSYIEDEHFMKDFEILSALKSSRAQSTVTLILCGESGSLIAVAAEAALPLSTTPYPSLSAEQTIPVKDRTSHTHKLIPTPTLHNIRT